jgi:hypothetical protein
MPPLNSFITSLTPEGIAGAWLAPALFAGVLWALAALQGPPR